MDALYALAGQQRVWTVVVVIVFMLCAVIVAWLVQAVGIYIGGSGIPQVQLAIERNVRLPRWWNLLAGKFIGGCICLAAGLSLGREGPCVQMGAWLGYGINTWLGKFKVSNKMVLCCGAGAGLAAAFSAPLAGTVFVLEELRKKISPLILMSTLLAAIMADVVARKVFGVSPVLSFREFPLSKLTDYSGYIVIGLLTGVIGVLFNKALLLSLNTMGKLAVGYRMLGVFALTGIVAWLCPQVLGGRDGLVPALTSNLPAIEIVLALLVLKFMFTVICYGSGVPGGIFLPLLMIGALAGAFCAQFLPLLGIHVYPPVLIVLAMAGCFSAIVKAPVTGMILIAEMTGSFTCFLPVAMVCLVAMLISDALGEKPIYEQLLERLEHSMPHVEV